MGRGDLFSLLVVLSLIANSFQLGNLFVNDIVGNSDFANVVVEQSIFNDNQVLTTYINAIVDCDDSARPWLQCRLSEDCPTNADYRCGVYVEKVNYFNGNVYIPIDLFVWRNSTYEGLFIADGGIYSDNYPDGDWSFKVEDNSGNTAMKGELRTFGGINADNGLFTVAEETGETTVRDALFKPNGGINVQNGYYTVSGDDGTFYTINHAATANHFFLGTSDSEDRYITRFEASSTFGGDTYILGQSNYDTEANGNSERDGGDIILETGVGQREIGKIILGRNHNDIIYFGRPALGSLERNGGDTHFVGQSTIAYNGGDIVFSSGDSTGSGNGGDLVLAPGAADTVGYGHIILGNTQTANGLINYDLNILRPTLDDTYPHGGATYLFGQSVNDGVAGDLYLEAGGNLAATTGVNFNGGSLVLRPGADVDDGEQADIVIGRTSPVDITIRRYPVSQTNGLDTFFYGANAYGGVATQGGDFIFQAGSAGNSGNGGDIILRLGDVSLPAPGNDVGRIFWGPAAHAQRRFQHNPATLNIFATPNTAQDLVVRRANSFGSGASLNFVGQESFSNNGGPFILSAGSGNGGSGGGDISFTSGSGASSEGGAVTVTGGDGLFAGGSIEFNAGPSQSSITINAGQGLNAGNGGSVILNAGSGNGLGVVQIVDINEGTPNAFGQFQVLNSVGQVLVENDVHVRSTNDVVLSANPESLVSYNGFHLIKDRINHVQQVDNSILVPPNIANQGQQGFVPQPSIDLLYRLSQISDSLSNIVNAFDQCGHGLMDIDSRRCNWPGQSPSPIRRPVA